MPWLARLCVLLFFSIFTFPLQLSMIKFSFGSNTHLKVKCIAFGKFVNLETFVNRMTAASQEYDTEPRSNSYMLSTTVLNYLHLM